MKRTLALLALFLILSSTAASAAPFAVHVLRDNTAETLRNLDSDNNIISAMNFSESCLAIGSSSDGTVYVLSESNIYLIDITTNEIKKTIPTGGLSIKISPDGEKAYVETYTGVNMVDIKTNKVDSVDVGQDPTGIAVSPQGKCFFIYNPDYGVGAIHAIDTGAEILTEGYSRGIAIQNGMAYVGVNDNVTVVSLAAYERIKEIPIGDTPYAIISDPHHSRVYAVAEGNTSVISTSTNDVVSVIEVGGSGGAISPDGTKLYIYNVQDSIMYVVDTADGSLATVNQGSFVLGVATSSKTEFQPPAEKIFPTADFSSNVTGGYAPLNVEFKDLSLNATERSWDFGDGSNSIEKNPMHTYSAAGNYIVNLTVSNGNGTDAKSATITVKEAPKPPAPIMPVADFSSNITSGEAPLSVQFVDKSENVEKRQWNFGDDSDKVSEKSPTHIFASPGVYKVELKVENSNGSDMKSLTVTVNEPFEPPAPSLPTVDLESNVTEGYAPLDVKFNSTCENADRLQWNFGDGGSFPDLALNTALEHTFIDPGTFIVTILASNQNGTVEKNVTITVTQKPLPPADNPVKPSANFTSNVTSGYAPLLIKFTDLSKNVIKWNWNFGDGANSTEKNPVHNYTDAGNYKASLTVSNKNGTDSKTMEICVDKKEIENSGGSENGGGGGGTGSAVAFIAKFSASSLCGPAPLCVQFKDLSCGGKLRIWDFGDRTTSNEINPSHLYNRPGKYTVRLTVISKDNLKNCTEKTITVYDKCKQVPTIDPKEETGSLDTDNDSVLSPKYSGKENPSKTVCGKKGEILYLDPKSCWIPSPYIRIDPAIDDQVGINESLMKNTKSHSHRHMALVPVANFTATVVGGFIQFNDSSIGCPAFQFWDFGDGCCSMEQNPMHHYIKPGKYTVRLFVGNVAGYGIALAKEVYISKK